MNILLMANHVNTGGVTSYLLNLCQGLVTQGHRVWIVGGRGNCEKLFELSGAKYIPLDIRVKSEAHFKIWLNLPKLTRLIKEHKIDIIHANTRVTQVMAASASALTGVAYVSTCHGFFNTHIIRKIFPCWGKGTIAVSRGVQAHLIEDFHLNPAQVVLIPNGIDTDRFMEPSVELKNKKRQQWKVDGGPIIGIIARLSDVKGIDVLVNAFPMVLAKFGQSRLWIVGEGPELKALEKLVDAKGLSARVRFEPIVNQPADVLPIFDLFVMPSLQEGLGLSVMEAQAAGIPVVASNVGGLPDLITDGETGYLVAPNQGDALAERIIEALNNPQKANQMAMAARQQVMEHFSLGQMTKSTEQFYNDVKGGRFA